MPTARSILRLLALAGLAWLPAVAQVQTDPNQLGRTTTTTTTPAATTTTTTAPPPTNAPPLQQAPGQQGVLTTSSPALTGTPPLMQPGVAPGMQPVQPGLVAPLLPLPPDPALSPVPLMFGSQIFSGRFGNQAFAGFNPDYQIAVGDRISVRMWGGYALDSTLPVDAQGNLFIPNVGPVKVLGVRNADLNAQVESQVKRTFRASVGVYAALDSAQPVKIYVTGFVRAPGLYAGLSSDSVLYYLDRAGGIDPARGSYLQVDVLRNGTRRARIDLYRFLLDGRIDAMQLQDGDTIVVAPRKYTVLVRGEVLNPYIFEFPEPRIAASRLLEMARPTPGATHLSVARKIGAERRSEYHALDKAGEVMIQDGDEVWLTADKYPGTILVRLDGAHLGERSIVLPYGSRLKDALARLKPAPQANVAAIQLYRSSVVQRQRDLLETSLRSLETYALTARSSTAEESTLRGREAELILNFVQRARTVTPRGQVVLADAAGSGDTLLEDGDVILVPEISNLVLVSGEVNMPNALVYNDKTDVDAYVRRAGGYTQGADRARVLVVRQDGRVAETTTDESGAVHPGDQVLVLPRIETKSIEVTRGITQILYQIAVAARIVFGL